MTWLGGWETAGPSSGQDDSSSGGPDRAVEVVGGALETSSRHPQGRARNARMARPDSHRPSPSSRRRRLSTSSSHRGRGPESGRRDLGAHPRPVEQGSRRRITPPVGRVDGAQDSRPAGPAAGQQPRPTHSGRGTGPPEPGTVRHQAASQPSPHRGRYSSCRRRGTRCSLGSSRRRTSPTRTRPFPSSSRPPSRTASTPMSSDQPKSSAHSMSRSWAVSRSIAPSPSGRALRSSRKEYLRTAGATRVERPTPIGSRSAG